MISGRRPTPSIFKNGPASRIDERHWQSGMPLHPQHLRAAGVHALILCAREIQPMSLLRIPGILTISAPMDDAEITLSTIATATRAAATACRLLDEGKRVLSTCHMGINRSGLVSALILMRRRGVSGYEAVDTIKAARPEALDNESFVEWIVTEAGR